MRTPGSALKKRIQTHSGFTGTRRCLLVIAVVALMTVAANTGTILSLTASGGGNFNETITISTTVRSEDGVNNSNFYFEIRDSNGTVVATHSFGGVPSLDDGGNFSYSWTSNNGSYPTMGNYTVSLCWSPGGSQNCGIASASSSFYSANSLGWFLTLILFGLIGRWLWTRRERFE